MRGGGHSSDGVMLAEMGVAGWRCGEGRVRESRE